MWTDNDTDRDFLNFTGVADTVAEVVLHARGEPVSIGVAGAWGVGKSSMIRLIKKAIEARASAVGGAGGSRFLFVDFNAWLYQGYDEARSALMDVIAGTLADAARDSETALDKAKSLVKRLNWFRLARLTMGSAAALGLGFPPVGFLGDIVALVKETKEKGVSPETLRAGDVLLGRLGEEASGLMKPAVERAAPREIQAIREDFLATLEALDMNLVVLIDDLDRCLPETTISTLEAIRLFLFLPRTAFVIAADDEMIRHAVRKHFDGVSEALVTNYFDKLIQVPIRVPTLGTQEVRAYLMLLMIEDSPLTTARKEAIRSAVCRRLSESWKGARVDRAAVLGADGDIPEETLSRLDLAERLAPILTGASKIHGNPRLIKRLLNALSIRRSLARQHGITVDDGALVKMLLFERCGNPAAHQRLTEAVSRSADGRPAFLGPWEQAVRRGDDLALDAPWDDPFTREWLGLDPELAAADLRGVLYVGREHIQIVTPQDRLSAAGAGVLEGLLASPEHASSLTADIRALPRQDVDLIMDRLLATAGIEQRWGVPAVAHACAEIASFDASQAARFSAFLKERPPAQIEPDVVPFLSDRDWAAPVLTAWKQSSAVKATVKRAIASLERKG